MSQWKSDLKGNLKGLSPPTTALERESFVRAVELTILKVTLLSTAEMGL